MACAFTFTALVHLLILAFVRCGEVGHADYRVCMNEDCADHATLESLKDGLRSKLKDHLSRKNSEVISSLCGEPAPKHGSTQTSQRSTEATKQGPTTTAPQGFATPPYETAKTTTMPDYSTPQNQVKFTCKTGWNLMSNKLCYKLYTSRATYENANESCTNSSSRLASTGIRNESIRGEIMEKVLTDVTPSRTNGIVNFVWIGLKKSGQKWTWTDGVMESTESMDVWNEDEPNNSNGDQNCARWQVAGRQEKKLDDYNCQGPHAYLCEMDANA